MSTLGTFVLVGILGSGTGVPRPILLILFVLIFLHAITYLVSGLVCLVQETDGLIKHVIEALLGTPILEVGTIVTVLVAKEIRLHVPLNEHCDKQEAFSVPLTHFVAREPKVSTYIIVAVVMSLFGGISFTILKCLGLVLAEVMLESSLNHHLLVAVGEDI